MISIDHARATRCTAGFADKAIAGRRGGVLWIIAAALLTCRLVGAVAGEPRSWTDNSGTIEFKAEFLRLEGDWVQIRRLDGGIGKLPLRWLSDGDQAFVKAASTPSVQTEPRKPTAGSESRTNADGFGAGSLERVDLPPRGEADKTVEGFIEYDIGKLRGSEGEAIREDFCRLGLESVPALIRGLNESAKIGNSCPIMVLRSKLSCCLNQACNPKLDAMAATNLCCGVPRCAPHYRAVDDLRMQCINRLPAGHPVRVRHERVAALVASRDESMVDRALKSDNEVERHAAVTVACSMGARFGRELIAALQDSSLEIRNEAHQGLCGLASGVDFGPANPADEKSCKDAAAKWEEWYRGQIPFSLPPRAWRATSDQLRSWLNATDEQTKTTAILAARYRGLFFMSEFVSLLNDPSQMVRREAHNALVDLAEGPDFGPRNVADAAETERAIAQWKLWEERRRRRFRNGTKTDEQIVAEFESSDDEVRLAAVSTAAMRHIPVAAKFVARISDRVPEIQQAARQGLILLAGGSDYGPSEGADSKAGSDAAARWGRWLQSYTPPPPPPKVPAAASKPGSAS